MFGLPAAATSVANQSRPEMTPFSTFPAANLPSQPKLRDVWISSPVSEPVFHDAYFER
jgi:hypothetical protein